MAIGKRKFHKTIHTPRETHALLGASLGRGIPLNHCIITYHILVVWLGSNNATALAYAEASVHVSRHKQWPVLWIIHVSFDTLTTAMAAHAIVEKKWTNRREWKSLFIMYHVHKPLVGCQQHKQKKLATPLHNWYIIKQKTNILWCWFSSC